MKIDTKHKRDAIFLGLSAIFLTSLVVGNIIGTTKFVKLFTIVLPNCLLVITPELVRNGSEYSMIVPAGVIAYPFTFLATDLISELFGRKKAQLVVRIGFFMNIFLLFLMTANHYFPDASGISGGNSIFEGVYRFMIGNVAASMIAYLVAQTIDVRLFHFWKNFTKGKHLWLRNNASTTVSQLVDSTAILSILFWAGNLGDSVKTYADLIVLILNSYLFKFIFALLDTPFFYLGVHYFKDINEDPSGHTLYDKEST
jgi:queuosine precursor transporter